MDYKFTAVRTLSAPGSRALPFTFAGHPRYLAEAGSSLGVPCHVVDRARTQPAVTQCANLLSQATTVHPSARLEILGHARERLDALRVATLAAQLMHDEVSTALFPPEEPAVADEQTPETGKPRRTRKASE